MYQASQQPFVGLNRASPPRALHAVHASQCGKEKRVCQTQHVMLVKAGATGLLTAPGRENTLCTPFWSPAAAQQSHPEEDARDNSNRGQPHNGSHPVNSAEGWLHELSYRTARSTVHDSGASLPKRALPPVTTEDQRGSDAESTRNSATKAWIR